MDTTLKTVKSQGHVREAPLKYKQQLRTKGAKAFRFVLQVLCVMAIAFGI